MTSGGEISTASPEPGEGDRDEEEEEEVVEVAAAGARRRMRNSPWPPPVKAGSWVSVCLACDYTAGRMRNFFFFVDGN